MSPTVEISIPYKYVELDMVNVGSHCLITLILLCKSKIKYQSYTVIKILLSFARMLYTTTPRDDLTAIQIFL